MSGERTTYLLVDGENIDATLGNCLGRRPQPDERPRWERLLTHAAEAWGQPVQGLFFLAAQTEQLPMTFVQALVAIGYRPVPLSGGSDEKVVDIAIQRTMEALADRGDDVILVSHDGDFLPQMEALLEDEDRRLGLMAFREYRNAGFTELEQQGMETFDLEYDVQAFNARLPRLRIIPIDEFDPLEFL
ncbi:uncharacterized protein SAMN05445756_1489 [Kytococcus aerolatus]|uniref:NYN domain-containing protein n=1 Tax=Kytococcus aerolatus TaxID=592308 RepID=A0A212TZM0_9MICO|nr:NYN domain-containing protein [Kytococcus aerolatus]SNC71442.1 uncharacterized protein SAMN05445756_1489 [Kytococcus aerolatus]